MLIEFYLAPRQTARTARRSKWPEPNTNYRQRKGELRKSVSTDEEGGVSVERENAKVSLHARYHIHEPYYFQLLILHVILLLVDFKSLFNARVPSSLLANYVSKFENWA
jgi:hypothetical protein